MKLQRWPVMIFSSPTNVKVGCNLDDIQLYKRLTRLGYSQGESPEPRVGEWRQSGTDLKLFVKHCPFVGHRLVEGPVTISLDDNVIKSIRLMRSVQDVKDFELEPELLGIIPAKGQSAELCVPVRLEQVPSLLIDSILLTEDNRFYSHSGIDIISIYRALIYDLQAGRYVQGASTITQQLIRMTLLNPEKTLWRKTLEVMLSLGADTIYRKRTILEAYLNRVYLGQFGALPVLGISEAARNFFGKSVNQLDVSECALIAAIIRAPNVINPFKHPERSQARRNMILGLLFKHGKISRDTYDEAIAQPIRMFKPGAPLLRVGPFIDMVKQQISKQYTFDNRFKNCIATSLDSVRQSELETRLKRLGEWAQQGYAIVANPKTGSIVAYTAPLSEKWSGSGGNVELFAPMALIPAFTPHKVNDPLYTLASRIVFPGTNSNKGLSLRKAFELDRKELIRKIIDVIGVTKIIEAFKEFRIYAKVVDESKMVIEAMTPLEVIQSYCALARLGTAGVINCDRPTNPENQTNNFQQISVSTQPAVLFIVNTLIRYDQGLKDVNDSPQKLLLSPSFLIASDRYGLWALAYNRTSIVLLRIPTSNLPPGLLTKITLDILGSPGLDERRESSIPTGLVFRKLCEQSGLRATSTCPHVTLLPFLAGTQPDEWCSIRH
ncbi:MAG: transglycosylase domain-containing protein [Desulfomonilaceae bacterium]